MSSSRKSTAESGKVFPKCPPGIRRLDEITFGGLPKGRPTLIAGGTGSGKTLMSMEFLVRGATDYNEPGVDLCKEPQLAAADQILAIPTLVRKLPEPIRNIVGDLSNTERMLVGLDIRPKAPT